MPAAHFEIMLKVPVRFTAIVFWKLARTIDQYPLLAVRLARLVEASLNACLVGNVDLAEHASQFRRHSLPALFVHVENGNLCASSRQCPSGRLAKTGCPTRHDGRHVFGDVHAINSCLVFMPDDFHISRQ
jgi:hypothetical protein